jgi:hypothetical protein
MIYLLALGLFGLLLIALLELKRAGEVHHGYFGALLCFYGLIASHDFVTWIGLILLLDDDVQHVWEVACGYLGRPIPGDFTPIHRLGSWLLEWWRKLVRLVSGGAG